MSMALISTMRHEQSTDRLDPSGLASAPGSFTNDLARVDELAEECRFAQQ